MFWEEGYHLKLVIKTLLEKILKGSVLLWFLPKRQDQTGLDAYVLNLMIMMTKIGMAELM